MDASQFAALGGVITAVGTIIIGVLATRSKVKLDDLATVTRQRDTAIAERNDERRLRAEDSKEAEDRHDAEIARKDRRIAELNAQIEERDRHINRLDRLVLAFRLWAGRLAHKLVDSGIELPDRPADLDN